jgi:hypothetical protein
MRFAVVVAIRATSTVSESSNFVIDGNQSGYQLGAATLAAVPQAVTSTRASHATMSQKAHLPK